jgi:hypothetical protein
MMVIFGMAAFAVDIGYVANTQTELQRSADAAALAACWQLVYQGTPGTPVDLTAGVAAAPGVAAQYASLNRVCGAAPSLADQDVVVGHIADPTQKGASIGAGSGSNYNAVQVTVRRTTGQNGQVPTFFGGIFGSRGADESATATAALISSFGGFKSSTRGGTSQNLPVLPFAIDKGTWDALLAGGGSDNWAYAAAGGRVTSGSDGVREVNLFPQGTGSPGNRGTVNIGASNNSTATLCRQIESGISPADLAYYPNGQLTLGSTGHLSLNANPGISAGCKGSLAAIVGQTRIIPIFSSVVGNGNNANYDIVGWAGVRILAVNLTGAMNNKYLMVEPATCVLSGGIPAASSSGQSSYGVYSPVWLVQ